MGFPLNTKIAYAKELLSHHFRGFGAIEHSPSALKNACASKVSYYQWFGQFLGRKHLNEHLIIGKMLSSTIIFFSKGNLIFMTTIELILTRMSKICQSQRKFVMNLLTTLINVFTWESKLL